MTNAIESGTPPLKYLEALVVCFFCTGLIVLSSPLFLDSVIAQRSISTITQLKAGHFVPTRQLEVTLAAIGPVDPENPPMGDRLINQGILSITLALRLPSDNPQRNAYLDAAIGLAEARLLRAPADTHTWARLAMSEYLLNGPTERAFYALRMSYRTGPFEYYVLRSRAELGLVLWPLLDEALRAQTVEQAILLATIPAERGWVLRHYPRWAPDVQRRFLARLEELGIAPDVRRQLTSHGD